MSFHTGLLDQRACHSTQIARAGLRAQRSSFSRGIHSFWYLCFLRKCNICLGRFRHKNTTLYWSVLAFSVKHPWFYRSRDSGYPEEYLEHAKERCAGIGVIYVDCTSSGRRGIRLKKTWQNTKSDFDYGQLSALRSHITYKFEILTDRAHRRGEVGLLGISL